MNQQRSVPAVLFVTALVFAACGGDDDDAAPTATDAPVVIDTPAATDAPADAPTTGPASIAAPDQSGDGASVVVDSVALPTDGFVVIHADADGGPGPILGWSDLLPAGESTDVTVVLNTPIAETATVHPMAHVDANSNGEYEFMPPDVTIDVPATTADGAVAMLPITYTVGTGDAGQDASAGLQLVATEFGDVIADADGWILYLFVPDAQGESTCYDECEATWPVVPEVDSVGEGVDPALLGTTTRTDGTTQATYNGCALLLRRRRRAGGDERSGSERRLVRDRRRRRCRLLTPRVAGGTTVLTPCRRSSRPSPPRRWHERCTSSTDRPCSVGCCDGASTRRSPRRCSRRRSSAPGATTSSTIRSVVASGRGCSALHATRPTPATAAVVATSGWTPSGRCRPTIVRSSSRRTTNGGRRGRCPHCSGYRKAP